MRSLHERLDLLQALAGFLDAPDPLLEAVILEAGQHNPWFTRREVERALQAIRTVFLDRDALAQWAAAYKVPDHRAEMRTIGLVMAGNIPLVGFHDWLSVFVSGHRALIKLSDKDDRLLPFLLDQLVRFRSDVATYWQSTDRLQGFDAVIATGSNNSARYFEAYFGKYPHIIRRNRNAVAVLQGDESKAELEALMEDIFPYYGLGCRSVSALRVPRGFEIRRILEAADRRADIMHVDRYRNNFDYQCALLLLNRVPFLQGQSLLLREDPSLLSPISTLHYQWYDHPGELMAELQRREDEIQCIVSARPLEGLAVIPPGTSQQPGLYDYADGVDTMAFINRI